jgi:hypothetical protein
LGLAAALAATLVPAAAGPAVAQLRDHLQCYRVRDPIPLQGVVDIDSLKGLHPGCRLGKAKLYCEPATKAVESSNRPILPITGRGLLDSRICYRVRCSNSATLGFGGLFDQFGQHVSVFTPRPRLLCVPAVYGPPATPMDNLDDLLCYRARETFFNLRAVVDADTRNLGLQTDCRVGHSRLFCAAAHTTIQTINVGPLLPIDGTGSDDDRVCYRAVCPQPHPGPQVVSDRFGSRTVTQLVPRHLCVPAPAPTTSTTTTMTTSTTTTLPPGTDPALICQRTIEGGGMTYALAKLNRIEQCAGPPPLETVAGCSGTPQMNQVRNQWRADAQAACTGGGGATGAAHSRWFAASGSRIANRCRRSPRMVRGPGERSALLPELRPRRGSGW